MEERFIALVDTLYHPNKEIREGFKKKGLYVYDMRDWDEGCGNTIEPVVRVNYLGSVVTNFEITNWDSDDEHGKVIYDMDEWIEKNQIKYKSYDKELEELAKQLMKE